jgi:hypothetical protein
VLEELAAEEELAYCAPEDEAEFEKKLREIKAKQFAL